MSKAGRKVKEGPAQHYDRRGVLGELDVRPVEFALEEELRRQILGGERARRLQKKRPAPTRMIRGWSEGLGIGIPEMLEDPMGEWAHWG